MSNSSLSLSVLTEELAVCRMETSAEIPNWALERGFFSVSRTSDELSIVCIADLVPHGIKMESGWKALKVEGPLDFSLTGILSSLALPLAKAEISIFAISTFDTDYVLVKQADLERAREVLRCEGHKV